MSADSGDVDAPNWLKELEDKRERRLRTKLGHEAGAGSPCLECKDRCPGLDLHFWRKICKNCRCGKENHDVQDDDIHGWVKFQLLGSKPKKPQKIFLPGENDEIELEWAPKGSKEAIESYLKDLPAEQLPIKGSSAAHERKQLLYKQIPIHDVDPSLCHALTEDETRKMNEYVNHLKENSVGVGQLMHISPRVAHVDARLVSSRFYNHIPSLEDRNVIHSDLSKNLQNLILDQSTTFRPIKEDEPIYANLPEKYGMHDYENIDVFGKHKLTASLEKIEKLQQDEEVVDKYGNPIRAQYAMILDKSGLPIKDKHGIPIRAELDAFGSPIIDSAVSEKIGPLAKPEYAILLDKNGVPILNPLGNTVKKPINTKILIQDAFDKFGNRLQPQYAVILDGNGQTIKDANGGSLRVKLDVFGAPIITKSLSESVNIGQAQYARILDNNRSPVFNKQGEPLSVNLKLPDVQAKFGLLHDENYIPIRTSYDEPIITNLDYYGRPILDDRVLEKLNGITPHYSTLLDKNGSTLLDRNSKPIFDNLNICRDPLFSKFKPKYGVLLDSNEAPIPDSKGNPIKVVLDTFGRAVMDQAVVEKLNGRNAEYAMFLDKNNSAILDKYGCPVKNIVETRTDNKFKYSAPFTEPQTSYFDKFNNIIRPHYGLLLDKSGNSINDAQGVPIKAYLDTFGRPLIDEGIISRLNSRTPAFVKFLDNSGEPILDKYGNSIKEPITNYSNNQNYVNVNDATLLDNNGRPILDQYNHPVVLKQTSSGAIVLQNVTQPILDKNGSGLNLNDSTIVGKQGLPILNSEGKPLKLVVGPNGLLVLNETAQPICDSQGLPISTVLDKYGNAIDPNTGRPLQYQPINRKIQENIVNPTQVNIGAINDINYPNYKENVPVYENLPPPPPIPSTDEEYDEIPQCHKCRKVFEDNALVIQIDRSEALWHHSCFKCAGCNQSLADLVYFYHSESNDIYCGRDFAKIRGIPRCNACDELIFVKEYCLAENETYHVRHFCCFECDSPLAGQNYVVENNQPVCISCFENLKADKCNTCLNIIKPDEQGANLNGTHFHANDDCFCCSVCSAPLLGKKLLFRNCTLYCSSQCFQKIT